LMQAKRSAPILVRRYQNSAIDALAAQLEGVSRAAQILQPACADRLFSPRESHPWLGGKHRDKAIYYIFQQLGSTSARTLSLSGKRSSTRAARKP
jgi:hypothetical protein